MNESIFKLYIDKRTKTITVNQNSQVFMVFNYYTDTVNHKIPHVLHKALVDKLIIPGCAFDLNEVYQKCQKYFIRVWNNFPETLEKSTGTINTSQVSGFDPRFLMLYDILYCNIIVNNKIILPAIFTDRSRSSTSPLISMSFDVILEDLDRHIVAYKYGLLFPKSFRMELSLINKIWYEKVFSY